MITMLLDVIVHKLRSLLHHSMSEEEKEREEKRREKISKEVKRGGERGKRGRGRCLPCAFDNEEISADLVGHVVAVVGPHECVLPFKT